MKKMVIILDGASDIGVGIFGGRTPFQVAKMPNLNHISRGSRLGYMYPIDEKTIPGSDNSLISIFRGNTRDCKRGVYEALGTSLKFSPGDLVLRTNMGTIDDFSSRRLKDRRAGRNLTTSEAKLLAEAINEKVKLSCKFEYFPTVQHRGILILRGKFSDKITNTDPEWIPGKKDMRFEFSKPLVQNKIAFNTAKVLNEFIGKSNQVLVDEEVNLRRMKKGFLPGNVILTRGGGTSYPKLPKCNRWMSINYMPLEIGIARTAGMTNFSFPYPELRDFDVYDNLYLGLNKSMDFAIDTIKKNYKNYEGCYIQFKETDIPGHDNKPHDKVKMLELLDKEFFSYIRKFIERNNIKLIVTCDHSTPCSKRGHSEDPVPVLFYDNMRLADNRDFNEQEARKGSLGKIYGKDLLKRTGFA